MNHQIILTQLEFVLLQLVAKGEGQWSWYEIAQALSRLDVPREPDMMQVLKKLATEGFLNREVQPGSPRDRWELTEAGKSKIQMDKRPTTIELLRKPDCFKAISLDSQ